MLAGHRSGRIGEAQERTPMTSDDTQRQDPPSEALVALAESFGIATSYHSFFGDLVTPPALVDVKTPPVEATAVPPMPLQPSVTPAVLNAVLAIVTAWADPAVRIREDNRSRSGIDFIRAGGVGMMVRWIGKNLCWEWSKSGCSTD